MVEKLSVQIQLEGAAEIERQLADVSKAGQQCFADIQTAAERAGGFEKLDPAKVEQAFKKFGITATAEIDKIKKAIESAGKLEGMVVGVADLEKNFRKVGTAASMATASLNRIGSLVPRLDVAFTKLGASISRALGPIGLFARGLGPIGLAAGAIGGGSLALVKFAGAAEDAFKALKPLQNASGESLENISALAIAFEQGGTPVKDFGTAFGNLSVAIADALRTMADDVEQSSQRVEQAYQAAAQAALSLESAELNLRKIQLARREERTGIDPRARANIVRAERSLQLEQAEAAVAAAKLAKQQAEHNVLVAEANDLQKIIDLYKQMAAGVNVAFNSLTSQATKNQALLATLAKAGNNWKFVLADILKTATELERIQIGKALGLSPEMIATLSGGSAKLQEMARRAQELGIALDAVDQANLQQLIDNQNKASSLFNAIKQKIGALVSPALASFWEGFTQRLTELIPLFLQIGRSIGQMDFSSLGKAAADFLATIAKIAAGWAAIISGQVNLGDLLAQALQQAGQVLVNMAITIGTAVGQGILSGIGQAISAGIGSIWDAIKQSVGSSASAGAPASPGFAGGGLLGGRGTGTSDSNLAWVSRGEYITPARAVAQPGVLAFLEALRQSGGNLSRVLNGMGRFALGGMVPRAMPAFAAGGLAGGSNVTIQFPGLPAIGGLRASSDVVDQLHRAAALAQVRSGGRKPSRYS